jgi:hypothetical protein
LLEVSKAGLKLGYLTSPPVLYEKKQYGTEAKLPALDPNHSHFIMVTSQPPFPAHPELYPPSRPLCSWWSDAAASSGCR